MGPLLTLIMAITGLLQAFLSCLLRLAGLVQPDESWPEPGPGFLGPMPASLVHDLLPVMKFRDHLNERAVSGHDDEPERCTVCLSEFRAHEVIRRLTNCGHIFHRGCVDRWIEHEHCTCPLCRTHFLPQELVEAFNEAEKCSHSAANFPEFGRDFSPINSFL